MRHPWLGIATLAGVLMTAVVAAEPTAVSSPRARLLDVRGAVVVSGASGPATTAVAPGQALAAGTKLTLEKGGSALLLLDDGQPVQLQGPIEYTVPPKTAPAPAGAAPGLLDMLWGRLRTLADSSNLAESAAGRVRGGGPELVYPIGAIVETEPTFRWSTQENSRQYRVTVRSLEGKDLASATVDSCEFRVPAKTLSPGEMYTWEVVPLVGAKPAGVSQGFFELPAESTLNDATRDLAAIRKQYGEQLPAPVALLAEGAYLESKELLGGALHAYRRALAAQPTGTLAELCRRAAESVEKRLEK